VPGLELFPDDGHQQVGTDGNPYLAGYRVQAVTIKRFDAQVLFLSI